MTATFDLLVVQDSVAAMPADSGSALTEVTVLFALALTLSLVVERILEILKAGYDICDSRGDWYHWWTAQAEKVRDIVERRLRLFRYVDPMRLKPVLDQFNDRLLNTQGTYPGTLPVISGDLVRAAWVRLGAKLTGIGIGVILAYACRVDLVAFWRQPELTQVTFDPREAWLTGVAIGLGSGVVHKLITTLERKRDEHVTRKS